MRAIKEIGIKKTLKFIGATLFEIFFSLMVFPSMRVFLLRLLGAKIGSDVIIHKVRFLNLYRGSFANLTIGNYCFLGGDVILDLADKIILGHHVTLAERAIVLTHLNVGYKDHPLQPYFPSKVAPTSFEDGSFVGVNSTILMGVTVGKGAFVASGSVVREDVPDWTMVGGVPTKPIRKIRQ